MYDLLKVSDGLIGHGDGFVNVNGTRKLWIIGNLRHELIEETVEFRLLVFRPFKGEIITGRIAKCTEQGIRGMFRLYQQVHRKHRFADKECT
jgi:DNA-directed RNA polymerase III subunit RPC8